MTSPTTDRTGASLYAHGAVGAAHVRAHHAFEQNNPRQGYAELAWFLSQHRSGGARFIHLHWHQLVFELALGHHEHAHERYHREIATVVSRGWALTDAPQALWRLMIATPDQRLDWAPVQRVARTRLARGTDGPTVVWHHLLALAGAGDVETLHAFIHSHAAHDLRLAAQALQHWVTGDTRAVQATLAQLDHHRPSWGSEAQRSVLDHLRLTDTDRALAA